MIQIHLCHSPRHVPPAEPEAQSKIAAISVDTHVVREALRVAAAIQSVIRLEITSEAH